MVSLIITLPSSMSKVQQYAEIMTKPREEWALMLKITLTPQNAGEKFSDKVAANHPHQTPNQE